MRAVWALFRLRTLRGLQYRTAAWAGMATQLAFGFLFLFIYQSFRAQNPSAAGLTAAQLSAYVWLTQAFLAFVMLWFRDQELFDLITSGNLAYEFCRPLDLYGNWFARLTAQRLSAAALRSGPILVVAALVPAPWGLGAPAGWEALVLFVPVLLMGLAVLVAVSMFLYLGTVITQNLTALILLVGTVGEFCSGLVVPLPFLPPPVAAALQWLPFRLVVDLPFRTWSGSLSPGEALAGLGAQVVWLAVLVAAGRLLTARLTRRLTVQGG